MEHDERIEELQGQLDESLFPETPETPEVPEVDDPVTEPAAADVPPSSDSEATTPAAEADKPPLPPTKTTPQPATDTAQVASAPKAWPREMHEHWGKLDPTVQKYLETREKQMLDGLDQYKSYATFGKTLNDVVYPFRPMIQQMGIPEPQVVATLLQAQARLTTGSTESRVQAYRQLGQNLGLSPEQLSQPVPQVDPQVQYLQNELEGIKSSLVAREQAALEEARTRVNQEVETFATDKAHPYFDEAADDIVALLQSGASLQDAYDKAIWANPITRQKELSRVQTETASKLRENARLDSLPKKKAASVNVRSRETATAPTEPLGTMDDTLADTLRGIKERVH